MDHVRFPWPMGEVKTASPCYFSNLIWRVLTKAKQDCSPPSAWVERFARLVRPGGRVLDLAAGGGRHTRLLLRLGHQVVAVDRDVSRLADLGQDPGCTLIEQDLEDGSAWRLGGGFDGIIVTNYLHRPLFPAIEASLGQGGLLIYETFAVGNERFGKPSNPAFLLRRDELLGAFPRLCVIAFEQGIAERPRPAMMQRIAMMKGGEARIP
jgi:SAM-dependent methyltransferase